MQLFALRLHPGEDLRQRLQAFAIEQQIEAGFIVSAIGSLEQVAIRFAGQPNCQVLPGKFEVLALNGTLSIHGLHLHIAISDSQGRTIGGHLCNGSLIYTTAEIVVGVAADLVFLRTPDPQTGFLELEIQTRRS